MSDLETACLRALRVFGPCSNAEVGRRLGVKPDKTYRVIYRLEKAGLVIHLNKQRWDISPLGRDHFARMPGKPLSLFEEVSQ